MWNSTKIKRERQRLDDMVTKVGMPPGWDAIGQYVWRCHHPSFKQGDELAEFLDPVSCAVAQEIANG